MNSMLRTMFGILFYVFWLLTNYVWYSYVVPVLWRHNSSAAFESIVALSFIGIVLTVYWMIHYKTIMGLK